MKFDIRWPMGILFLIFGALITLYGWMVPTLVLDGLNPNLIWGAVLFVFGGWMSSLAYRSGRRAHER